MGRLNNIKKFKKCFIDIGGTNIRIVIYNNSIEIKKVVFKNDPNNFSKVKSMFENFLKGFEIEVIVVGMPGPADYSNGILLNPPNLIGWWNINLKKILFKITKAEKIYFENDACLMALAHHNLFSNNKNDITQFFTISTGIGASLIINNSIYKGFSGLAQSIAHLPINSIDEKNNLSKGAVEHFSSGSGIFSRAEKYGFKNTKEVFDKYNTDQNAKKIIDEAIEGLGNLIAASVALINPSNLFFDGSVSRKNKWYIEKAIILAKTRMYEEQSKSFKWYISNLEDDAVLKGAHFLIEKIEKENNGI